MIIGRVVHVGSAVHVGGKVGPGVDVREGVKVGRAVWVGTRVDCWIVVGVLDGLAVVFVGDTVGVWVDVGVWVAVLVTVIVGLGVGEGVNESPPWEKRIPLPVKAMSKPLAITSIPHGRRRLDGF